MEDIPFYENLFNQLINDPVIQRVCCTKLGINNPLINFDPFLRKELTIFERLENWINSDNLNFEMDQSYEWLLIHNSY